MYYPVDKCEEYAKDLKSEMPLIPCEYNHTMGNSSGNLAEYWQLVRKYPIYQGASFGTLSTKDCISIRSLKPIEHWLIMSKRQLR